MELPRWAGRRASLGRDLHYHVHLLVLEEQEAAEHGARPPVSGEPPTIGRVQHRAESTPPRWLVEHLTRQEERRAELSRLAEIAGQLGSYSPLLADIIMICLAARWGEDVIQTLGAGLRHEGPQFQRLRARYGSEGGWWSAVALAWEMVAALYVVPEVLAHEERRGRVDIRSREAERWLAQPR